LAALKGRLLVGSGFRVDVERQLQFRAIRVVRRGDGEPAK
jgi:hypothetical protein